MQINHGKNEPAIFSDETAPTLPTRPTPTTQPTRPTHRRPMTTHFPLVPAVAPSPFFCSDSRVRVDRPIISINGNRTLHPQCTVTSNRFVQTLLQETDLSRLMSISGGFALFPLLR